MFQSSSPLLVCSSMHPFSSHLCNRYNGVRLHYKQPISPGVCSSAISHRSTRSNLPHNKQLMDSWLHQTCLMGNFLQPTHRHTHTTHTDTQTHTHTTHTHSHRASQLGVFYFTSSANIMAANVQMRAPQLPHRKQTTQSHTERFM